MLVWNFLFYGIVPLFCVHLKEKRGKREGEREGW
jgi:hypothetical protein